MTEDEARKRFMTLNLVRFFAIAVVFFGIANIAGRVLPDFAPTLGYVLLVFGAADFFFAPMLLKKIWRDRDG